MDKEQERKLKEVEWNQFRKKRKDVLEQYARAFENRKPGMEGLMLSGVVPRELSEKLK